MKLEINIVYNNGETATYIAGLPEWSKWERKTGKSIYSMKDIPLNSILSNGSQVCAVMQISNLDKNGNLIEKMYKVKRGLDDDDDIIVSGSHLVYDSDVDDFVHVKDLSLAKITDIHCPVLYCLITSDHTIPIGDWIFHDWEDNNGSESKSIGK